MNVEMFFVKTESQEHLAKLIAQRLSSPPDLPGKQPDWGLESSYDLVIAQDKKRKIAISPSRAAWVAGIESKEALDFALLHSIATELKSTVIAVQLADAIGACGYARCDAGTLKESYFNEEDEHPLGTLKDYLNRNGVPFKLTFFRDAIQLCRDGWRIL